MDEQIIELLRRRSGLSLDRDALWRHDGELITHARTIRVLNRGLEVRDDGETIVRIGDQWAYVAVEDTPYVVTNVSTRDAALELMLSDGTREDLDPSTLELSGESDLTCRVKEGRARARFSRTAWHNLLPMLTDDDGPALLLGRDEHRIRRGDRRAGA